jgi:hypothetical protein
MVSCRLKGIIEKRLYEDLSHVEIIEREGEIWFIDREEKFWYFMYNKSNGEMWWRYSFFTPFFSLFSLPSDDFTFILSSWVEEVLNHKVATTKKIHVTLNTVVEKVLSYKINRTGGAFYNTTCVEEVLNNEV